MKGNTILIVDDVEINREILALMFQQEYTILEAENGKEAIENMKNQMQSIAMVLLDLYMPQMNGFQVLEWMNETKLISSVPVILITGEQSEEMEWKAYEKGVSDIIHKPFNGHIVKRRVQNIIELYQHKNHMESLLGKQNRKLKEQNELLQKQTRRLQEVNNVIIDTMSNVVEFRNLESGEHIKRIKKFTRCLTDCVAEQCPEYGLTEQEIKIIEQASAMHDIGKIAIPDSILLKPGKLTAEEFEIMKTHASKGCELIERIVDVQGKKYSLYCYEICRHHHERYDGRGYPDGLKEEEIPIAAQIVSVADVYDALVSKRVYKSAYKREKAYEMIQHGECGAFSPKLLKCFGEVKVQFAKMAEENEENL